jgi:hypothetical protein
MLPKHAGVQRVGAERSKNNTTMLARIGSKLGLKTEWKRTETGFIVFVSACLAEVRNENKNPGNKYESGNHQRWIRSGYVTDTLQKWTFVGTVKYL